MAMKRTLRVVAAVVMLVACYILLQILFQTIASFIMAYIDGISFGDIARAGDVQFVKENPAFEACMVRARALCIFLSTVTMILFIHFAGYYKLRWSLLRSVAPRLLLLSTLLVFSSMFALNILVQWFPLKDNLTDIFQGLSRNALGVVGIAFLAPLLEEVLFRGAIQGVLMRFFGRPWPAIITAALVFGIIHWNPVQTVYATLFGIVLGWIYYRTGSLMYVIVGHVLNNALAVVTTVSVSAANEEVVANSPAGVAGFVLFALLSVYLAVKVKSETEN